MDNIIKNKRGLAFQVIKQVQINSFISDVLPDQV